MVTVVGLFLAVQLVWQGALQSGALRISLFAAATVAVAVVLSLLAARDLVAHLLVVAAGVVATALAVRVAFGRRGAAGGAGTTWTPLTGPSC